MKTKKYFFFFEFVTSWQVQSFPFKALSSRRRVSPQWPWGRIAPMSSRCVSRIKQITCRSYRTNRCLVSLNRPGWILKVRPEEYFYHDNWSQISFGLSGPIHLEKSWSGTSTVYDTGSRTALSILILVPEHLYAMLCIGSRTLLHMSVGSRTFLWLGFGWVLVPEHSYAWMLVPRRS